MYPDFMEKSYDKVTYLSQKSLGQLFRQNCVFEMGVHRNVSLDIKVQPSPYFEVKGMS